MTNREFLIGKIYDEIHYPINEIYDIFNLIYERDYAYFCSEMGDYDYPEERIRADKVFDKEMKNHSATLFEKIVKLLDDEFKDFYNSRFHSLAKEYIEE